MGEEQVLFSFSLWAALTGFLFIGFPLSVEFSSRLCLVR